MKNLYIIIISLALFSDAAAQNNFGLDYSRSNDFTNLSGTNEIRLKDYHILWVFNDVGNHNTNRNGNSTDAIPEIESSNSLMVETSVYPVPAQDHLNFTFSSDINSGMIIICDAGGKIIMTQMFSGSEAMISSNDFIPGIYFYQIFEENKSVSVGKFLKK